MVKVEYALTPKELAEGIAWHCRIGFRPAYRVGLWFVAIALGVVGGFFISNNARWLGAFVLSAALFIAISQAFTKLFVRFRARKQQHANVTMQVDDSGVIVFGLDEKLVMPWAVVSKVVKAPVGYLLYMGRTFIWIPNGGISSISEMERLIEGAGVLRQTVS